MRHIFTFLLVFLGLQLFAGGEISTYFNIYIPPNNTTQNRFVGLVVTAIYDSTYFNIVDDGMDGDTDDSVEGMLMAGQSYILYIKDNGVNDDSYNSAGGVQKQDGDYFIITSNKLIYASQSTNSDWQHDWVPATNKTSKGQRFFIYSHKNSYSNRDVNIMAYEDETTVSIRKISQYATTTTGYTSVDINNGELVAQRTLNVGEDIIHAFQDGVDLLDPGITYLIESNKEITVQYGALSTNSRDGGGYVPGSEGGSADELFYFTVPYQVDKEQEIRIISNDDQNNVTLERYGNGAWVSMKNWNLDARQAVEWVGRTENGTYPTVFRVTCSSGKKVMVLEANWMETGAIGTSDMSTMATAMNGYSAGKNFLVYMSPPGYQNASVDPFTGEKLTAGSHAYLFANNAKATITVKDANTNGQVINRIYVVEPNRYADCNLTQAEWYSIFNGDGNANSGTDRPYLIIESDANISVLLSNFNDNWMNYFGSSLEQSFTLKSSSTSSSANPGDTLTSTSLLNNSSEADVQNAKVVVSFPDGISPISSSIVNTETAEVYNGEIVELSNNGKSQAEFDNLTTIDASTEYVVSNEFTVDVAYENGTKVENNSVLSLETITSGTVNGVYQESSTSTGISINSENSANMMFVLKENSGLENNLLNSWTSNWVDYDGDNDLDLFFPAYNKTQQNELYKNIGNGQFTKVSIGALGQPGVSCVAATWADIDKDGDLDVFLANNLGGNSKVFSNNNGNFTELENFEVNGYHHNASWLDADNDGDLELFALDFMPTNFNDFYWNNTGTYSLDNNNALVLENTRSTGASWCDFDKDGFVDVFIPNGSADGSGVANKLFRNIGNGTFEEVNQSLFGNDLYNSVGSSWGDFNNDGYMDLFVANASNAQNQLYQNNGDGSFIKVLGSVFQEDRGNSHGAVWLDFDNDADLDLIVMNSGNEANFVYRNDNNEGFVKLGYEQVGANIINAIGLSAADMDKDGDLDLCISTFADERNYIYQNKGNNSNYLSVKLVGTVSNRSAVGAKITCYANGALQYREINAQSGFGGQSAYNQHFGLANNSVVDSVVVEWPSGIRQVQRTVLVNQEISIVESSASTIKGILFADENGNCVLDEDEARLSGVKLNVAGKEVTSNSQGEYSIAVELGSYNLNVVASKWQSTCVDQLLQTVSSLSSEIEQNIALQALVQETDLAISIGNTAKRRGFKSELLLNYQNKGTEAVYNVPITLNLNALNPIVSSSLAYQDLGNNQYQFVIDTILPMSNNSILITDSVSLDAERGDIFNYAASISSLGDVDLSNNNFNTTEEIVGAVDPNDIIALTPGVGSNHLHQYNEVLRFKIRFQNTGNYYAENVWVQSILPEGLDVSTLNVIQASHDYILETEDQEVNWRFPHIKLPDSVNNEPESHGFIIYEIMAQENVLHNTQIENQAAIVFDFEKPVITNIVDHILVRASTYSDNGLVLYPNPCRDHCMVKLNGTADNVVKEVNVYDITGNQIDDLLIAYNGASIDCSKLKPGNYLVKAILSDGKVLNQKLAVY